MEINIRDTGKGKILALSGRLDRSAASEVFLAMREVMANQPAMIFFGLAEVHFVDSNGLAILAHCLKQAREKQCSIFLFELQPPVRLIFELTRFDKIFEIYISEEAAVWAASR